ncbi:MAG: glycosyltransferase family 2 protein [Fusobacteriaceae bacterium]|nr:glycosyltransferase family 2 protein [Fusobacteriaceae bacterium]
MKDLSIIVVAWDVKCLVEKCLSKIKNSKDNLRKEIIFVDNGSFDGTSDMIKKKFPDTVLIKLKKNVGFIRANNIAYKKAKGKYILLLNSDAFIGKYTLQRTVNFMEGNHDCGVLGARLVGKYGKLQFSARYFPTPLKYFLRNLNLDGKIPFIKEIDNIKKNHKIVRECDWVPGCYLLTRKKIIDDLGFLLRNDFFNYYDDLDICLRIKRKGWKIMYYPETVVHLGGFTNKKKSEKVTEKGCQIEKYDIESGFIYFRKNYNLFYALQYFFFLVLMDLFEILKRLVFDKKEIIIKERLDHIKIIYDIMIKTKFGKIPVH